MVSHKTPKLSASVTLHANEEHAQFLLNRTENIMGWPLKGSQFHEPFLRSSLLTWILLTEILLRRLLNFGFRPWCTLAPFLVPPQPRRP